MRFGFPAHNVMLHMPAMRYGQRRHICAEFGASLQASEIPALRVGDKEIAEGLHARDAFELLRVDEIGVERDGVGLAEQLHQPAIFLDQIVRQHRNAQAALAGAQYAEDVVDDEKWCARSLAVTRHLNQPLRALEI